MQELSLERTRITGTWLAGLSARKRLLRLLFQTRLEFLLKLQDDGLHALVVLILVIERLADLVDRLPQFADISLLIRVFRQRCDPLVIRVFRAACIFCTA